MYLDKKMNKLFAIIALFFYALCWFVDSPSKTIHYIGIALPWLSLALSIPIAFLCKVKDDNYFSAWGYVYAVATVLYVVIVSVMSGSIWYQLPHLAACICFIAYFTIEHQKKKL